MRDKGLLILLGIGLLILWRTKEAKAAVIPERRIEEDKKLKKLPKLVQYSPPPPGFYIAEIIPFRRVK